MLYEEPVQPATAVNRQVQLIIKTLDNQNLLQIETDTRETIKAIVSPGLNQNVSAPSPVARMTSEFVDLPSPQGWSPTVEPSIEQPRLSEQPKNSLLVQESPQ